jgi:NAD(P)H-flavin reductase
VGVVVPDFDTSDALYLTGTATILTGDDALALLPRTRLAVKITVAAVRYVKGSLPFRGTFIDYSPYSPPVRHLVSERDPRSTDAANSGASRATALLLRREEITPSISRFVFKLTAPPPAALAKSGDKQQRLIWHAGQYVTLDFSGELDMGYSHMRNDDPQSINDDFIRTFTISSPPTELVSDDGVQEFEITARKHGPATGLLWRHKFQIPLELPVLGFGGDESFRLPVEAVESDEHKAVAAIFVAGGVGVTPVLAQAKAVLATTTAAARLRLLWSLHGADLGLAADAFATLPGLGSVTSIFVTGGEEAREESLLQRLREAGATVVLRRMEKGDVDAVKGGGQGGTKSKFFLCTGPGLLKQLERWLEGEEVVSESFSY